MTIKKYNKVDTSNSHKYFIRHLYQLTFYLVGINRIETSTFSASLTFETALT